MNTRNTRETKKLLKKSVWYQKLIAKEFIFPVFKKQTRVFRGCLMGSRFFHGKIISRFNGILKQFPIQTIQRKCLNQKLEFHTCSDVRFTQFSFPFICLFTSEFFSEFLITRKTHNNSYFSSS